MADFDFGIPYTVDDNMPEDIVVLCPIELSPLLTEWMKLADSYKLGKETKKIALELLVVVYNGMRGGTYATIQRIASRRRS